MDGQEERLRPWERYLETMRDEDTRLITRWQKILDTLLVYVGIFMAVLTSFIIQTMGMLQPRSDEAHDKNAAHSTLLLATSLTISIMVAAVALIITGWLTRYQRPTETRPTIHEHIRRRNGLMGSGLPHLVEMLPIVALIALLVFVFFIWEFVQDVSPSFGIITSVIFALGYLYIILAASLSAFIPETPFHSPLSDFIQLIFQILPNRSIRGVIRIRTMCVITICLTAFVCILFLEITSNEVDPHLFLAFMPLFSLFERSRVDEQPSEQPKLRIFGLSTWIYSCSIVVIILIITSSVVTSSIIRIVFTCLSGMTLCVMTYVAIPMSQRAPREDETEAEALASMFKSSSSHDFQKALQLATDSPYLRPLLLKAILPVLEGLIKSIGRELKDEEETYVELFCVLVDFEPRKAVFWCNEAALEKPPLSDGLQEKLDSLPIRCTGDCNLSHHSPRCAKGYAEFIGGFFLFGERCSFVDSCIT